MKFLFLKQHMDLVGPRTSYSYNEDLKPQDLLSHFKSKTSMYETLLYYKCDFVILTTRTNSPWLQTLASTIDGDGSWSCSAPAGGSSNAVNLLKGIYDATSARDIFATTNMTSEFTNLKTVSLKVMNNNVSIPGKTGTKFLQNNKISRGKNH